MTLSKDKSPDIHRFSFFGWNVYITRGKLRRKDKLRSRFRTTSKARRLMLTDNHCELCGIHINLSCSLYHLLPKGCEGRNEVQNIRVMCPDCFHHTQRIGVYRPMLTCSKKGGEL